MNHGQLLEVAAAIADGMPIDWAALDPQLSASSDFALPARIVQRIAQVHATLPPVESFVSSLHKSLEGVCLPGDGIAVPETPVTWGALTIVGKIGRGTFGDVYRAHDRRLNRSVALKLLRRKDRFESAVIEEGHLMARVRHPNVVTVYGAERIEGRVGLWMEFIDGPTLEDEARTRGPFAPNDVAQAGIQLAQALAAVHSAGLLHRDIKAQNAMRDADGRVLLTDFGTGRELSDASDESRGRELAGTPLYMAPEVLDGGRASVSSDVYSLGVVLYHLATGSFPITGRSLRDLREAHQENRRTLVRTARPDLPKRLAVAIDRATDPDPERRYASASDFEAALAASARRPLRRPAWIAAAGMALAAVSMIPAWQWRQSAALTRPEQSRDLVLVTRFDNTTGDTTLDGGIEYAIARELSRSDLIEVVPAERVIDALQLMKRPVDTVVDRTVGREVCLREGGIKALVTGRIDKVKRRYVITTELVDPADGAVVASITDNAGATAAVVVDTVMRHAQRVAGLFAERRASIKGASPVQQVSTVSLAALQLHSQAVRVYWSGGGPEEAERINTRALAEDPDFAAAWMVRAYFLAVMKGPGAEARVSQSREAARRAVALGAASPEWERRFLLGVNRWLSGDYAGSVSEFDAAVRLRPDFEPAVRFLTTTYLALGKPDAVVAGRKSVADLRPFDITANFRAAYWIVAVRGNPDEARPYVNRLDELLNPERAGIRDYYLAAQWRRILPAYEAWKSGDITGAQAIIDREAQQIDHWHSERDRMREFLGLFYITLGRFHDAERHLAETQDTWGLGVLDEVRDDLPALRRHLLEPPKEYEYRLVKAGLLAEARARLEAHVADPIQENIGNIGRAALALAAGSPEDAIRLLRHALPAVKPYLSAEYQNGCDILATALIQTNRRAELIRELEACGAVPPGFWGNFNAGYWMKNLLRLADEYRAAGRISDAEPIEQQLRRLLVYADRDNPLVVRLNAR